MSSESTEAQRSSNRRTPRNFLTDAQRRCIIELGMQSIKTSEIAARFHISPRQVRTVINEHKNGQCNKFTKEDDELILRLYSLGMTKESEISKHIKSKSLWMIRNRIKFFRRNGKLPVTPANDNHFNTYTPQAFESIHEIADNSFADEGISQVAEIIPISIDSRLVNESIAQNNDFVPIAMEEDVTHVDTDLFDYEYKFDSTDYTDYF